VSEKLLYRVVGAVLGLLGPPVVMFTYYHFYYGSLEFSVFIDRLLYSTLFAPVLSLCVLINLLLFFGFIWMNKDEGARGVLLSTILYAIVVFTMKIF
jgi:hypothetical protein